MTETPTVETMTAEVRVITIGAKRLTLSMYRQLDCRRFDTITVFGRVHAGVKVDDPWGYPEVPALELIGRDNRGNLVRSFVYSLDLPPRRYRAPEDSTPADREAARLKWDALVLELRRLPLIVLGR